MSRSEHVARCARLKSVGRVVAILAVALAAALLLLNPAAAHADSNGTISGRVLAPDGNGLVGITVTAHYQAWWGSSQAGEYRRAPAAPPLSGLATACIRAGRYHQHRVRPPQRCAA
jgi:hypothetical protein